MPEKETLKDLVERTIKESIDSKFNEMKKNKDGVYSSYNYEQEVTNKKTSNKESFNNYSKSSIGGRALGSAISYGLFWNPITNYLDRKYQIGQKMGNFVAGGISKAGKNIWNSLRKKKNSTTSNNDETNQFDKLIDSSSAKSIINAKLAAIKINNAIMVANNLKPASINPNLNELQNDVPKLSTTKNNQVTKLLEGMNKKLVGLDSISKSMKGLSEKILPAILNKNTLIVGGVLIAVATLAALLNKLGASIDKDPVVDNYKNPNQIPDQEMNVNNFSNTNVASLLNKKTTSQFKDKNLQKDYSNKANNLMITSPYGQRNVSNGSKFHQGIDIGSSAGESGISGLPVYVPFRFIVSSVNYQPRQKNNFGAGNNIIVDRVTKFQPNSFYNPDKKVQIHFMHLSEIYAKKGSQGGRGTVIGSIGHSGGGEGKDRMASHLHIKLIVEGRSINPESTEGKKYMAGETYKSNGSVGQSYIDFMKSSLRGQDKEQLKTVKTINKSSNSLINNLTGTNLETQLNSKANNKVNQLIQDNNKSNILGKIKNDYVDFSRQYKTDNKALYGLYSITPFAQTDRLQRQTLKNYTKVQEANRNEITSQQNSNKINQTEQDIQKQKTKNNLRSAIMIANNKSPKGSVAPIITGPSKMDQIQQATIKTK